jgi:hypothetical protein
VETLRGTEDMLLWRHRIEAGFSTEANYGRFYPGYARPTNRWIVRKGVGEEGEPQAQAGQSAIGEWSWQGNPAANQKMT